MRDNGTCPKCGSDRIYTTANARHQAHRGHIAVGAFGTAVVHTYACARCGYLEDYVVEKDRAKLEAKLERVDKS